MYCAFMSFYMGFLNVEWQVERTVTYQTKRLPYHGRLCEALRVGKLHAGQLQSARYFKESAAKLQDFAKL